MKNNASNALHECAKSNEDASLKFYETLEIQLTGSR
jgi:hypothetical protein